MASGRAFQGEYYDEHYVAQTDDVRAQRAHPLLCSFEDNFVEQVLSLAFDGGPVPSPVRVYEPGCGEGLLAEALMRVTERRSLAVRYTGSDLSSAALELARETVTGTLVPGDAIEVTSGFPGGSFDVVIAKNLLHHLDEPAVFLQEAARVLGAGGRIIVAEPRFGQPLVFVANLMFPRRERHYFKGPRRNHDAVRAAGLEIVREQPFCWFPYELACATRLRVTRKLLARVRRPKTIDRLADLDARLTRRMPWWSEYYLWVLAPAERAGSGTSNV